MTQSFWDVVASMSAVEQGELLHFITSCPRQPLRGFGQLNPLICVQVSPNKYVYKLMRMEGMEEGINAIQIFLHYSH